MGRIRIVKKDGSPTRYFWSEGDGSAPTRKRVYKETSRGVMPMRGIRFDSVKRRMHRRTEEWASG